MFIGIDCHQLEGERTGVGRVLENLLREWAQTKPFEAILYFRHRAPDDIPTLEWGTPRILGGPTNWFRYFGIARAAERDRVNILFSPMYLVSPFFRGRAVPMIQDLSFEAHPEWVGLKTRLVFRTMARWSARKAAAIIVPSEFTKQEVVRCYDIPPERITAALLAAAPMFSRQPAPAEVERVKREYTVGDALLLTFGTIFTRRHIPEAIAAVDALADELPTLQYLLVGRNETRPRKDIGALAQAVNARHRREVIRWQDRVPEAELTPLVHAASAVIYLSDYEGFGLPVIESLACATPVITNRSSSLPEAGGDAAWYVDDPTDSGEIASAIRDAITNETLRRERIERGLAYATGFSWARTASNIETIFRRAVSGIQNSKIKM